METASGILARYASEELPEYVGVSPLHLQTRGNFGNTPLHIACVRGAMDEVMPLLDAGADVDASGEIDNTPLHEAVGQGHVAVVEALLERGASPGLLNRFGESPIDTAKLSGNHAIEALIAEHIRRRTRD
jgi:ankyrin repeat protein